MRIIPVQTNQENKGQCETKINRLHTNSDITYLKDWVSHVKLSKAKGTEKYLKSWNEDQIELKKEVKINRVLTKTPELVSVNQMKRDCFVYDCFTALKNNAGLFEWVLIKNLSFYFYCNDWGFPIFTTTRRSQKASPRHILDRKNKRVQEKNKWVPFWHLNHISLSNW
jgi:hypothetical protein